MNWLNSGCVKCGGVFRTVKVKLPFEQSLLQTAVAFNRACQMALDYGSANKIHNKDRLNKATYTQVRVGVPNLPSALVQTARDEASEMLKRANYTQCVKKRLSVRYDNRCFKFYPETNKVSLTTVHGRLIFAFKRFSYLDTWRGQYTNAQLVIRKGKEFLNIQVSIPDVKVAVAGKVLGIDRGILNAAACSDNTFFGGKHLRAVEGRYRYNCRCLGHVGARSAHRKLQRLGGRERRFVRDTNHCISKTVAGKPFGVFALEKLRIARKERNGERFNILLGSWSPSQLALFIAYKAEGRGKIVVGVDPRYTSQRCGNCGFELNADLDASRNIGVLGKSRFIRLFVNEPIAAGNEALPTGIADSSCKPPLSRDGS
jgi:IS605 OrfB family transposase